MAKAQPLKLSDLRPGVEYPVVGAQEPPERRCLFHVKLTDFSMRSIESLMNSDKDACFSLWFADGGGSISIPGSKEYRKFTFKTSQGDIDGLDCVHQAVDVAKQPQLSCWGQIKYKLQVQGTKEVYERTKKLMKETEEQKQKTRTQTINFPHSKSGRSKHRVHQRRSGGGRPLIKTSSPFSAPSAPHHTSHTSHSFTSSSSAPSVTTPAPPLPLPLPPSSSSSSSGGGASFSFKQFSAASGPVGSGTTGPTTTNSNGSGGMSGSLGTSGGGKTSGTRKSSKAPHTLKERIIHLLAVKPQRRSDIINRLKKETKRGETAMTKTDSLLQEVAEVQGDVYCLKQSLYSELRVDDWPFYSEAERQLVKRRHGVTAEEFMKRTSSSGREAPPTKRQKLSHPPTSTPPPPHTLTQSTKKHSPPPPTSKHLTHSNNPSPHLHMPQFGLDSYNSANPASNIEIQSSLSHTSFLPSNQNPSSAATKPLTQYPGSVFSNFVRSSGTSLSSSSLASSSSVPTPAFQTTAYRQQQQQQQQQHQQQQVQVTGAALHTGLFGPTYGHTGLVVPSAEREVGGAGLPAGASEGGKVFGDLLTTGGKETEATGGGGDSAKKKKKKKNRTKDKPMLKSVVGGGEVEGDVKNGEEVKKGVCGDVRGGDVRVRGGGDVRVKSETVMEENGASSTTPSTVDLTLMYPPITSDATRAEYKKIFNEEYQEYLSLKAQVEIVNKEVTALGDQVAAVKKGTEEAKVLKRKIREKYTEIQQNMKYQSQKRRFQELHTKLEHIKKLVMAYDQSH